MGRHRSPDPPRPWPQSAIAVACADGVLAVLAVTVAIGTSVAPDARAVTAPQTSAPTYVPDPTLPRTYGPLRAIFTPAVTSPSQTVATDQTVALSPPSVPRTAADPFAGLPVTPATTERTAESISAGSSSSQPSPTTATPPATVAPTSTTPAATTTPTPTTPPTTTEAPEPTQTEETPVPIDVTIEITETP